MSQKTHSTSYARKSSILYVPITWEGELDAPEPIELPPAAEIAFSAATNAILGGINMMIKEGMNSYEDYASGKIDQKQYTYRVMVKGSAAAAKSGGKTVVALSLKEGVKVFAKKLGAEGFKRFARSNAMTAIAFGVVDQGADTYKYYKGELNESQYKINSSENLGGTGGAIGGAAVGAMLGSVVPGLGTGAGALLGSLMGMLGAAGGATMGKSIGENLFGEHATDENVQPPSKEDEQS